MVNAFYTPSGVPSTSAPVNSSPVRTEFASIARAFDLFPPFAGNAGKALVVNLAGTALTVTESQLALAGNLTTTGGFTTSLTTSANVVLALPTVDGTLALLESPAFVGSPTAPTPMGGANNTQIATTSFVQSTASSAVAAAPYLPLAGGVLTGGMTAPTVTVSGALSAATGNITTVNATTLNVTNVAASNAITAASVTATTLTGTTVNATNVAVVTGAISAPHVVASIDMTTGGLTASGAVSAASMTAGTLTVTGAVAFTALPTVGGLPLATQAYVASAVSAYVPRVGSTTITGNLTVSGVVTGGFSGGVGYAALNSGDGSHPGYVAFHNAAGTRLGYAGYGDGGANLYLVAENSYTGWAVIGNLAATGNLTAPNSYATTAFRLSQSGASWSSDAGNTVTELAFDVGLWRLQYLRASGALRYVRGSDNAILLTIDGSGNVTAPGTISGPGLVSSGNSSVAGTMFAGAVSASGAVTGGSLVTGGNASISGTATVGAIMNNTGAFYVAGNTNYYLARDGGTGTWYFVENTVANASINTAGTISARGNVIAAAGVFSEGATNFGFFSLPGSKYFQYSGNWFWQWNTTTGTLLWANGATLTAQWVIDATGPCYNNLSYVGGNGAYVNISDERMKENIEPDNSVGLAAILGLDTIRFTRKNVMADASVSVAIEGDVISKSVREPVIELGFSAQQVRSLIPEAVHETGILLPDGTGGMDTDSPTLGICLDPIVVALVNAVKEIAARVTALEA